MKRWHEDVPKAYKRWNDYKKRNVFVTGDLSNQLGRFRKRSPSDCGVPRCSLCHWDKYPKREKTYQEKCSELKLKEEITDYESGRCKFGSS